MTTTIYSDTNEKRLDVFLADNINGLTRSAAQKLLDSDKVTLNGVIVRKNHKTSPGEAYIVLQDEPDASVVIGQNIPLDIIFEDKDLIIVNKPCGMVVHPAPGHHDGTLVNALLFHCGSSLSGIGGVIRPGIVHRIDKNTSGLVIAAKNDKVHLSLASQLSSRTLTREYQAVVFGNIKNNSGTIDVSIGRHPTDRKKQAVFSSNNLPGSAKNKTREAITHYEVIARYNKYTHVRCCLETGRTHQIRVHMAFIGHPVIGDTIYGHKKPDLKVNNHFLHAWRLRFIHPFTQKDVEVYAKLPEHFNNLLEKLVKSNERS